MTELHKYPWVWCQNFKCRNQNKTETISVIVDQCSWSKLVSCLLCKIILPASHSRRVFTEHCMGMVRIWVKVLPGGGYLKKNVLHTFSGRHLSRHFYKAFAFSLCIIYAHIHTCLHTYIHVYKHTHVFMSLQVMWEGRHTYICFKNLSRPWNTLPLLGSTGLFGNSFQNAPFGEKHFTNQSDSLKASFAMIAFTRVGGRGKFCFISSQCIQIFPFLDLWFSVLS